MSHSLPEFILFNRSSHFLPSLSIKINFNYFNGSILSVWNNCVLFLKVAEMLLKFLVFTSKVNSGNCMKKSWTFNNNDGIVIREKSWKLDDKEKNNGVLNEKGERECSMTKEIRGILWERRKRSMKERKFCENAKKIMSQLWDSPIS